VLSYGHHAIQMKTLITLNTGHFQNPFPLAILSHGVAHFPPKP